MPNILELLDCKTKRKYLFEYDQTTIDLVKSKQHVFWDDVPDQNAISQVLDSKRAINKA